MSTVERVTQMIIDGKFSDARSEIRADIEFAKATSKKRSLNDLQIRDLYQAITEAEINV